MNNDIKNKLNETQWFIITVIGGKEDTIINALKEKIKNFGYDSKVTTIRMFKEKISTEEIFKKDDPTLPKSLKNTKTTTWESLPNGSYKKITTKIKSRFPGYVFINMMMDEDIWYAIRNTPGVLGFVGSSGKGAMPIPITIEEYANIEAKELEVSNAHANVEQSKIEETKVEKVVQKTFTTDIKIGNTIEIIDGSFAGMIGNVVSLDNTRGIATIEMEMFGRITSVEVNYSMMKITE